MHSLASQFLPSLTSGCHRQSRFLSLQGWQQALLWGPPSTCQQPCLIPDCKPQESSPILAPPTYRGGGWQGWMLGSCPLSTGLKARQCHPWGSHRDSLTQQPSRWWKNGEDSFSFLWGLKPSFPPWPSQTLKEEEDVCELQTLQPDSLSLFLPSGRIMRKVRASSSNIFYVPWPKPLLMTHDTYPQTIQWCARGSRSYSRGHIFIEHQFHSAISN